MAKTYTIDELLALPGEVLNALAAELRGWTISKAQQWNDGQRFIRCDVYNESDGAVMQVYEWTPVTNRDQSGELLRHAQILGVRFTVHFWDGAEEITGAVPRILLNRRDVFSIFGNDARAETVAFCAAIAGIKAQAEHEALRRAEIEDSTAGLIARMKRDGKWQESS